MLTNNLNLAWEILWHDILYTCLNTVYYCNTYIKSGFDINLQCEMVIIKTFRKFLMFLFMVLEFFLFHCDVNPKNFVKILDV